MIVSGLGWWGVGLGVLKPILQLQAYWQIMIVSGLGWWSAGLVILKLGLRPSFIPNDKLWFSLDLDEGALDLSIWSRHFSVIFNDKLWSFPDLDAGTLDLSFWSWALAQLDSKLLFFPDFDDDPDGVLDCSFWCRSFSFILNLIIKTNCDCFRTQMMGHWIWSFEAAP